MASAPKPETDWEKVWEKVEDEKRARDCGKSLNKNTGEVYALQSDPFPPKKLFQGYGDMEKMIMDQVVQELDHINIKGNHKLESVNVKISKESMQILDARLVKMIHDRPFYMMNGSESNDFWTKYIPAWFYDPETMRSKCQFRYNHSMNTFAFDLFDAFRYICIMYWKIDPERYIMDNLSDRPGYKSTDNVLAVDYWTKRLESIHRDLASKDYSVPVNAFKQYQFPKIVNGGGSEKTTPTTTKSPSA